MDINRENGTIVIKYFGKEANEKGFYYRINGNNCKIMSYKGSDANVEIPSYINDKPVRQIGTRAFAKKGIQHIFMPDTIYIIREGAFAENPIEQVELPGNICVVEKNAFLNCHMLREVTIGTYTADFGCGREINISQEAFLGTSYIDAKQFIVLDNMLLRVNDYGSQDKELIIPEGVRDIKRNAYHKCNNYIEKIHIPESVRKIEDFAFARVMHLKEVSVSKKGNFNAGYEAFGSFDGLLYRNIFIQKLRKQFINTDGNAIYKRYNPLVPRRYVGAEEKASGWIHFRKLIYEYEGGGSYGPTDVYVPAALQKEFWKIIKVNYSSFYYRESGSGFEPQLFREDYKKLIGKASSLYDKIQMMVGIPNERAFLKQHIYKAVKFAVKENDVGRLSIYKDYGLFNPENGFQSKKVQYLTGQYHNEAAEYLKKNVLYVI